VASRTLIVDQGVGDGQALATMLGAGEKIIAVSDCIFRTIWARIPEDPGKQTERSDGFISGPE
jgi:hypothetical protein